MPQRERAVDRVTQDALAKWAEQRRRIFGTEQSVPSILGRLQDQGLIGAGSPGWRNQQPWSEVYSGDGLVIQRILANVSELPRLTVSTYYIFTGRFYVPASRVAQSIGISARTYWVELGKGEEAVSTGLRLLAERSSADGRHRVM